MTLYRIKKTANNLIKSYIFKRFWQSFITIFLIIFAVFMMLRLMPIEGYFTRQDYDNMSEAQRLQYLIDNQIIGNPFRLFIDFMGQVFKGNLGLSFRIQPNVEITRILSEKIPYSLYFGLASMVLSLILGFGLGMLMARFKDKFLDGAGTVYIVIVRAVPSLIYLFLIQIWVTRLFNIPLSFSSTNPATWILPVISLSLASVAWYAIWLRRFLVDEENKDYVKFARAKGVNAKDITRKHILRNALVPLVQYIPLQLLLTISGSLIIESLYSIPGMGGLLIEAIKEKDNGLVQILVMLFSILGVFGVFLGDMMMALIDPRIKFTSET